MIITEYPNVIQPMESTTYVRLIEQNDRKKKGKIKSSKTQMHAVKTSMLLRPVIFNLAGMVEVWRNNKVSNYTTIINTPVNKIVGWKKMHSFSGLAAFNWSYFRHGKFSTQYVCSASGYKYIMNESLPVY